jgi:hypothetical protein
VNRRATILLRGLARRPGVVFGDAVVTQIRNPVGQTIQRRPAVIG